MFCPPLLCKVRLVTCEHTWLLGPCGTTTRFWARYHFRKHRRITMLQTLRSEASTSTGRALDFKFLFRNLPHITSGPHPERPLKARCKRSLMPERLRYWFWPSKHVWNQHRFRACYVPIQKHKAKYARQNYMTWTITNRVLNSKQSL